MKWLTLTALTTILGLAAIGSLACNEDGDELTRHPRRVIRAAIDFAFGKPQRLRSSGSNSRRE